MGTVQPSSHESDGDEQPSRCGGRAALCLRLSAVLFAGLAAPAGAATATNGLIAFQVTGSPTTIRTVDPVAPTGVFASRGIPGVGSDTANPAWSADGAKLAFSAAYAGGPPAIWTIDADGNNPRRLVADAGSIDPTWSPDGRQIAFTSVRNGSPDIYVINADGTGERRLTSDPTIEQQADWSPDGSKIAYESDSAGSFDIWQMAPDGSSPSRLTTTPAIDEQEAAWRPDGTRLAFSAAPRGGLRRIFSIDSAGADLKALATASSSSGFPAWSPDGTQIAYGAADGVRVIPWTGGAETLVAGGATEPVWARLPVPVATATADVEITRRDGGKVSGTGGAQTLPEGTDVDATNGTITIGFRRPAVSDSTPVSSMEVTGAEFTVAKTTPDALTLRLDPLDCPGAAVAAAGARGGGKKTKVRVSGSRKGGHGNIRFGKKKGKKSVTPEHTRYTFTETCRGATIRVAEGSVRLDFVSRSRRKITRRVTAGRSYFIPS